VKEFDTWHKIFILAGGKLPRPRQAILNVERKLLKIVNCFGDIASTLEKQYLV